MTDHLVLEGARRAHALLGAALPSTAETARIKVGVESPEPAKPRSFLGLSQREISQYSIGQAALDAISGKWKRGTLESACHDALMKQGVGAASNRVTGGFFLPYEIAHRRRSVDMTRADTVGSGSGGGYLVGTEVLSFIDLLRNRIVAFRLGAQPLPMGSGNGSIPKLTAGASTTWLPNETTQATNTNQTLSQLSLVPHTISAYTEISRTLLLQSPQAAEMVINTDLPRGLAVAVDAAAIAGTGTSGQPVGICTLPGTNAMSGSQTTNIQATEMISMQQNAATANSDGATFAYTTTPTIAAALKARGRLVGGTLEIWLGDVFDAEDVVGARGVSSNNVPSGTIVSGPWGDCVIATWDDLEIAVNPVANFQAGIIGVSAFLSCDVAFRYPAAWTIATGVT